MVIGLGRFGTNLAMSLNRLGYEVLAVDASERHTQAIASDVTRVAQADATDEEVLRELDAGSFDIAIVAIGSAIESSVLATILLKKFEVPYIIARANNELHGSILTRIGADMVVYPEIDAGARLAHLVRDKNVVEHIPAGRNYGVTKITAPHHFIDHKLSDLGFDRDREGLTLVLLQRGDEIILSPGMSEKVKEDDVLILAGKGDELEQLLTRAEKKYAQKEEKEKQGQK
jgi:trk system potassium uptake protein TrkA